MALMIFLERFIYHDIFQHKRDSLCFHMISINSSRLNKILVIWLYSEDCDMPWMSILTCVHFYLAIYDYNSHGLTLTYSCIDQYIRQQICLE